MKKSLLAFALFGAFASIASAQTSVNIYGIVDTGVLHESGGKNGSVTKLSSGIASSSRLGFRGTEDLGSGWSAIFVLETGFRADTGELDNTTNTLFNRQTFVGLKGNVGAVTFGRQYTPYYVTISTVADPFGAGYAGSAKNLLPTVGTNTRTSNTVLYTSPNLNGFSGELAYSLGEQAGSNTAGRQFGAALAYSDGPLNVRVAYNNRNTDTVTPAASKDLDRNTLIAANYNFGVAKAYLAYGIDKGPTSAVLPVANAYTTVPASAASTDSTDMLVGVAVPFGAGTILASYIDKNDKTRRDQDAHQWALGYNYALSKRTSLYASYAQITNKNGAGYTVGNNSEVGLGDKAYNFGVRHTF